MKTTLSNLICLESNVKIYIPGTVNVNHKTNNQKYIDLALNLFSGCFGGSTKYQAIGTWISPGSGLIKERINIIESYCTENDLKNNIDIIIEFCKKLKYELNQENISLEINNKLYFI
jgi:hypothetical protein